MHAASVPIVENLLLCCPPPEPPPETRRGSGNRSEPRKRCVFVVDDEPLITDTLVEILSGRGFEAVPFYDSRRVISEVDQRCPDVLLTDVIMPHVNGLELATRISNRCPHMRVLLLSGQAATANLLRGATQAAQRFELLQKPIDPRLLLEKLTE